MLLNFAEWAPDIDPFLGGADQVVNALPSGPLVNGTGSFSSFNSFVERGSPLPSQSLVAFTARDPILKSFTIYIGAKDAIYQSSGSSWGLRYSGVNLVNSEWSFVQYKNKIIACALDVDTLIADINGLSFSPLFTSIRKPKAAVCAIVNRDSVVLGNTVDDQDGIRPSRVWFLASGNPSSADPDINTLCDFEDLDEIDGPIVAITGREYGIVYTSDSIWRMTFVGPPVIFRFDKMTSGLGLASKSSLVSVGRLDYGLNDQGFFAFDGVQVIPIGANRFDNYFWKTLSGDPSSVFGAFSYRLSTIFWAYPTSNGTNIIAYNWTTGRASILRDQVQRLFNAFLSAGYTDDPEYAPLITDDEPLASKFTDSPEFIGGEPLLLGLRDGTKLVVPEGPPLNAHLCTQEMRPNPSGASEVKHVHAVSDVPPDMIRIGSRASKDTNFTYWTGPFIRNSLNFFNTPAAGTYLRFEALFTTAFERAIGLDVEFQKGISF